MKKLFKINQGIIGGEDKETIVKILPQLESQFKQRKQYWEYYFDEIVVDLTLEDLEELSSEFIIELNWDELKIKL